MMKHITRPLAALVIATLTACGPGGGGNTTVLPNSNPSPQPGTLSTTGVAFVGIGDSLTAGYQSDGFLGDPTATAAGISAYPGGAVPPGQENGWWSLFYQSLTNTPTAAMYNAPTSPLPLIGAPGLGTQLVLNLSSLLANVQSACSTPNLEAFSSSGWTATRLSASAPVTDLGVPGITMHEAIAMSGPLTGPPQGQNCSYISIPGDPTSGGLQSLVMGESSVFYPVMGGFQSTFPGSSLTELNVATGLKPKLTTVWLGANDLLKFIFSNGQSPISDSPTQIAADLTSIVKSVAGTGSQVLVADLPTVLTTAQFFPQAKLTADYTDLLIVNKVPPATAAQLAAGLSNQLTTAYGLSGGGYLTESGFLGALQQLTAQLTANPASPPNFSIISLDPSGPGSGAGAAYITPAFATTINAYNAGINQAIDAVATGSGPTVALVPINTTFTALAQPNATLATIIPGAPALTLQFGGGLLSWDGLHPSNAGYAAIADIFMNAAVTAFKTKVTPLTGAQITAIAGSDPYNPTVVDTALGGPVFPLP